MITELMKDELDKPLDAAHIKHRQVGRGRSAPYVEGFDVIDTANRIFGYEGWSYIVETVGQIAEWIVPKNGDRPEWRKVEYQARVRVIVGAAIRVDVGTGITEADTPEAHDTALKGAVTDAMKRALRTFGSQFGNSLYDKTPEARPSTRRAEPNAPARPATAPASPPAASAAAGAPVEHAAPAASGPAPMCSRHSVPYDAINEKNGKRMHQLQGGGWCVMTGREAAA